MQHDNTANEIPFKGWSGLHRIANEQALIRGDLVNRLAGEHGLLTYEYEAIAAAIGDEHLTEAYLRAYNSPTDTFPFDVTIHDEFTAVLGDKIALLVSQELTRLGIWFKETEFK